MQLKIKDCRVLLSSSYTLRVAQLTHHKRLIPGATIKGGRRWPPRTRRQLRLPGVSWHFGKLGVPEGVHGRARGPDTRVETVPQEVLIQKGWGLSQPGQ